MRRAPGNRPARAAALLGRVAALVGFVPAVLAGCGPNPPCAVDPSDVDAARAASKAADARLDVLNAERDRLEDELEEAEARRAQLEVEQEQKREELKRRGGGK